MSQVSYGTITINDLTDITDVYLEYALVSDTITRAEDIPSSTQWSTTYPTWVSGKQIWIRRVTRKEGIDIPEYGTPYLDKAVSQIQNNYIGLSNKLRTFFYPGDSTYSGAFAVSKTSTDGLDTANANTYGFNARVASALISMGYNKIPLLEMGLLGNNFNGIKLYSPILTNNVITGNRLDATLTSEGLKLLKGGIEAGTPSESNFIYLSTNDYPLRQFIHTSDISIDTNKEYYELNNNEFVLVEEPEVSAIANYYEISVDGIAINGHIPTEISVDNRDIPWRQIIGNNFGVDADGNLYATGANISGRLTVTGGNVYTKDETDNNLNNTVNEAINNIDNNVIYAYSANNDGTNYSYDNSNLQYRGIFVTNQKDGVNSIIPPEKHYEKTSDTEIYEDKVYYELVDHEGIQEYIQVDNPSISDIDNYYEFINEEPNKFQWEINPIYAEQHASNYIADFQGGIKISAASNTTNAYLSLTAVLMQFWLNQRSMAQFGYDSIYESYGISVENVMITGAGNALRLDNGLNGTYQGQFILETRSNGHLSLKPGLSRTEEEEI